MSLFKKAKPKPRKQSTPTSSQSRQGTSSLFDLNLNGPRYMLEMQTISKLRALLPFMDVIPLVYNRLIGHFTIESDDPNVQEFLRDVYDKINVNGISTSWPVFQNQLVDSGVANGIGLGEAIPYDGLTGWYGLKNIDAKTVGVSQEGDNILFGQRSTFRQITPFPQQELIYYFAPDLRDGYPIGYSIYHGMPWMATILERLYKAIDNISWRIADPSFLITVIGGETSEDADFEDIQAETNEAARALKASISNIMKMKRAGRVGDAYAGLSHGSTVSVEIIGAGGEAMVEALKFPIEEMIKPCIGKSGIPDYVFGYNFGRTESLSDNQFKILMKNITWYRKMLDPIIKDFFNKALVMEGFIGKTWSYAWDSTGLEDNGLQATVDYKNALTNKVNWEVILSKVENGFMTKPEAEHALGIRFTKMEWGKIENYLTLKSTVSLIER